MSEELLSHLLHIKLMKLPNDVKVLEFRTSVTLLWCGSRQLSLKQVRTESRRGIIYYRVPVCKIWSRFPRDVTTNKPFANFNPAIMADPLTSFPSRGPHR